MDIDDGAAWPFSQKLIMAVLAFFLNVVLLNLLISIMGDSYGQVLEMRDRTDALTRLEMISEAVIYKKIFKPNHNTKRGSLVYCLPLKLEEDESDKIQEIESSIIKSIQSLMLQNNEESKQELQHLKASNEAMKNEISDLKASNEAIKASNESLKETILSYLQSEFSRLKTGILIFLFFIIKNRLKSSNWW